MSEEQKCTTNTTEQEPVKMNAQELKEARLALLRAPFPPNQINKLPKPTCSVDEWKKLPKARCQECGGWHATTKTIHLDYVGHAALTDRLLDVDPEWTWEPLALDESGLPRLDSNGGLWIRLTVCGVTRYGFGDAQGKTGGNAVKELIGDALRNAAMRFGAALELWHKGALVSEENVLQHDIDGSEVDFKKMDKVISQAVDIIDADDEENGPVNAMKLWESLTKNEKIYVNGKLKEMSVKMPSGHDKKYTTIFKEYLDMAVKQAQAVDAQ